MTSKKGIIALILVNAFWGTSFPVIKTLMGMINPSLYATYRSLIAALMILPMLILYKGSNSLKDISKAIHAGILLGSLYFFGLLFQAWGMVYTEASSAAFITSFNVPLVCLLEILFLKRKPSLRIIISMILAMIGVILLTVSFGSLTISKGDLLVLACTLFWALQVIFIDVYSKVHEVLTLTFTQLLFSGLIGLGISTVLRCVEKLSMDALFLLCYLALFCSVITCSLQIYGQRYTTSTQAAIIYTLEPVFASLFSFFILHEVLSGVQYLGAMMILIATFLASTYSAE
ncbi:MAG: hypothetical protein DRZ82_08630 [Thermoprotei archaeon]|nr:MAG: hypothetical protein DRZ82_08630 [Thermoprotei archaeon]